MSLLPNTTYYVRVKAVNSESESDYSNIISVTTLADNTQLDNDLLPSNLILHKINASSNYVDVIFNLPLENEYIREYQLTLSSNSDLSAPLYDKFIYGSKINTSNYIENNTTYSLITVGNLISNTNYYGRLIAINKNGNSNNLDFSFNTTSNLITPELLGITNLTQINATVNWLKVKNATGYVIDIATTNSFTPGTLVVDNLEVGNVDFRFIDVLIQNTTYWVRIRAKNITETSLNSNVISFTTLNASATLSNLSFNLLAPNILNKTSINSDSFKLIWSNVEGANYYSIDISLQANFSVLELSNVQVNNTNYTVDSLTEGTLYYVRIKAVNSTNSSQYTITNVTTLSVNSLLNPPQLLSSTDIKSNSAVIQWIKRSYATRYLLEVSQDNFSTILTKYFTNDVSSLTLDNLDSNALYYVRIYGLSSVESSLVSNTISFTTAIDLPQININPLTEITDTSAIVNWSLNSSYVNYFLTVYKKVNDSSNAAYLGNGYYNSKSVGNLGNYLIDVFLEPNTTYEYFIEGVTINEDRKQSNIQEFTTRSNSPTIQISADNEYIEWSGNLNRLEIATDKEFKFKLVEYQDREITNSNQRYKISNILNSNKIYYIRGYYYSTVKGLYSNVVSTLTNVSKFLVPTITHNSINLNIRKGVNNGVVLDKHKIQLFILSGSDYVPVIGYELPVDIGTQDTILISNLVANTNYLIQLYYLNEVDSRYYKHNYDLQFKTNQYENISAVSLNNALTTPTASITNISYDRFTVSLNNAYSLYLIEISRRIDFLQIEKYVETSNNYEYVFDANKGTEYYVRVVGIQSNQKSLVQSLTVNPTPVPSYPTVLIDAPVIISNTLVNENESIITFNPLLVAAEYKLEISQSITFNLLDYSINIYQLDTNKILLSGLLGTKVYYVRVYGFNSFSISPYSNIVVIDTTP